MSDPTVLAQQAEAKADAKVAADVKVATESHTIHGVRTMLKSPAVAASTATGAIVGGLLASGPLLPAALIGAGVGFVVEHYRVLGGPVGRLMSMLKRG